MLWKKKLSSILVVDDDTSNHFMVDRLLRLMNICEDIRSCKNGKDALCHLSNHRENLPSLILLDINMPVMDGYEFVRHLKKIDFIQKKPQVVFLTCNDEDFPKVKSLGDYGFISKPITKEKMEGVFKVLKC